MMTDIIEGKDSAVLTCWKDIAQHMGKAVRTVQRWEMELGLPVRRPNNAHSKSAVVVYVRELDSWMASQWSERDAKKITKREDTAVFSSDIVLTHRTLKNENKALVLEHRKALNNLIATCHALQSASYPPAKFL